MRQRLPALVLVFMAPLVAELLAGTTPLGQPLVLAFLLPIYLPLYGAGALLMRELVRRSGRGWASMLLLGAAYGFIEEGFASQSLFNPTLYHAADWGARILGINGVFTESVSSFTLFGARPFRSCSPSSCFLTSALPPTWGASAWS
jgi:hypothetical protein